MMRPMRGPPLGLRACALLGAAALAVHELRYLAGWGSNAGEALASRGHAYLGLATPLILLLLMLAVGAFLGRLASGRAVAGPRLGFWRLWLVASLALLAIYTSQELIEGAVAPGHPAGLAGAFGSGGWVALPLAGLFGALVALLLRGAEVVLARAEARARSRWSALTPALRVRPAGQVCVRVRAGLARHLAGRGPPLVGS